MHVKISACLICIWQYRRSCIQTIKAQKLL